MALNGSNPPAPIIVSELTLRIPMRRNGRTSLRDDPLSLLANFYLPGKTKKQVRTLLDNISFEVGDGHRLGLIGRNGAGKTTLLRVLAGSLSPTRGSVKTTGVVQALLNVTLGLQEAATGVENIYLRGLSMGMTLAEIRNKIPEIIEFSELGEAIHDPLQTYSAGMRARLAFAITTSRSPNILLMDEWLGTGDRYFVQKAEDRLESQIETCRALVIASHSSSIIKQFCTHGLVMDAGQAMFFGKVDDALNFYDEMSPKQATARATQPDQVPSGRDDILAVETSQGRILIEIAAQLSPQRITQIKKAIKEGRYDGAQLCRAVGKFERSAGQPAEAVKRSVRQSPSTTRFLICFEDGTLLDCNYKIWGRIVDGPEVVDAEHGRRSAAGPRIHSARASVDH
jgi:ABC-type polysaccharide/polyol phosphate transport system ATPase subunit/cyclophilin family peptidyl-prolyl cis-trans isomerase